MSEWNIRPCVVTADGMREQRDSSHPKPHSHTNYSQGAGSTYGCALLSDGVSNYHPHKMVPQTGCNLIQNVGKELLVAPHCSIMIAAGGARGCESTDMTS